MLTHLGPARSLLGVGMTQVPSKELLFLNRLVQACSHSKAANQEREGGSIKGPGFGPSKPLLPPLYAG